MSTFYQSSMIFPWLMALLLTVVQPAFAATYYVSPAGNDNNSGSLTQPFRTIRYAISVVQGGDQIYLRGGTYYPSQTIRIERASGSSTQRTKLFAYQNERPIIDGSRFTVFDKDERDNVVFRIKAAYWHIKGLEIRKSPTFGITINGQQSVGNILEALALHDNQNTGLTLIGGPSQTLVLNCDAYRNFDPRDNGQNGDGFSAIFDVGTGNIFRGCRSWANSDDGYDLWKANNKVVIDQCWAYDNGFDRWNVGSAFAGNGEGFKLGRNGGAHLVKNCLSWGNRANGFLSNSNTSGVTVYNCTAWDNQNLNFSFYGPERHVLRNCIAYPEDVLAKEGTDDAFNSWNLNVTVDDRDFMSLADQTATGSRESDGGLPESDFLKLAANSDLIDQGTPVGLPYRGSAPDLGAYERSESPPPTEDVVTIRARGTTGQEQMVLRINDQAVKTWSVTKSWANYTYQGEVRGNIKVAFTNDKYVRGQIDRNLRIDRITVGSATIQAEAREINTGAWQGTCGGGSYSEQLDCNGYIDFGNAGTNGRSIAQQNQVEAPWQMTVSQEADRALLVYPNPASEGMARVSVGLSKPVSERILLINGQGQVVVDQATNGQERIDLDIHALPEGVYLLKTSASALTRKLIVQ